MITKEQARKTFDVFLDDNNIVNIIIQGVIKGKEDNRLASKLIVDDIFSIYAKHPDQRFNIFTDITKIKTSPSGFDKETKDLYTSITQHRQTDKNAVLGSTSRYNFIIKMVLDAMRSKVGWFTDREEAMSWLQAK
jgi:hypothetical protein